MRRVFAVLAFGLILGLCTSKAAALGFGRVGNASLLGQPLDFSAVLILEPGESISSDCVSAEVLAGDIRIAPSRVQVSLNGPPRGSRVQVRVTTTQRIVEPVVTVRLSAGCTTRHSRSFVAFLEPVRGAAVSPTAARIATTAEAAPAAPVDPAAAASAAAAQQRDRERVLGLEQSLERAHADIATSQQNLLAMQARLREAEAARRNPPLVYGLATLVVLLMLAIAALLSRLARARRALANRAADSSSHTSSQLDAALHESPLDHTWTQMRVVAEAQPHVFPAENQAHPITVAITTEPQHHELTLDELIDLEQQADFFIALSQDDAAIDLLMGQLRSSGGTSPMPYLKLLDIYRRRGDADAHERIRERFNRRFSAHAPALDVDPQSGRELDAHPEVLSRLVSAWSSSAAALALLESLIYRVDDADPGFDLPAFTELVLLHSVVRDLREREASADGVDLLLPLDDERSVISASPTPSPPTEVDLHLP